MAWVRRAVAMVTAAATSTATPVPGREARATQATRASTFTAVGPTPKEAPKAMAAMPMGRATRAVMATLARTREAVRAATWTRSGMGQLIMRP